MSKGIEHNQVMDHVQQIFRATAPAVDIRFNEPMRRHTSFTIDGPADVLDAWP